MDNSKNSFAKHSLKIASVSFNQRYLTRKLPESFKCDLTIMSSYGMHSSGGKMRSSADDIKNRRKSPILSSKRGVPTNCTIREILKREDREMIGDKMVQESLDLDAKVTVECNHYNQWARTRRSDTREPKNIPLEQCGTQSKTKSNGSIKSEQVYQSPGSTRANTVTVTNTVKDRKENTMDLKPDLSEEEEKVKDSSVGLYDRQTSGKPISWDSWSGRTRIIPGYVLRELHRSCGKIVKDVQKASNEFYRKTSSEIEKEQYTGAPEKRIPCGKGNIVMKTDAWMENLNNNSLSIRKLPAIPNYQGNKITSCVEKPLLQTCEKWALKTSEYQKDVNSELGKTSSISQSPRKEEISLESLRKEKLCFGNSVQHKTRFSIAKKELLLFDNQSGVVDFRSKRLENLCKLCDKDGRWSADIKTGTKSPGRRRFRDNPKFSLTFKDFLNMPAKNTSEVKTLNMLNEFNINQNSSSFRLSIDKAEDISGFVKHFGQDSKVANACL